MFSEYTSLEDCEKVLENFENTESVEKERKTTNAGVKQWYKCNFLTKEPLFFFIVDSKHVNFSL